MTEFLITSSLLILVVAALRHLIKGKISLRLQYALWALVLVRLLVPGGVWESPVSVMNAVERSAAYKTAEQALLETQVYADIVRDSGMSTDEAREAGNGTLHEIRGYPAQSGNGNLRTFLYTDSLGAVLTRILRIVWLAGILAVGLCLLLSNLSFGRKLRKTRRAFRAYPSKLPVYAADTLPSPCLFGLFRPAIYLTPEVAGDETKLRHVLAHELTHYRHGDHVWSALRGLCLAIHWYNPLVWLAAALSRRDAELACDEGTIRRIGEASRMEYGRTLIGLTCEKHKAMDLLSTATTMTDGKKGIRERILLIAKKPKMLVPALIAVLFVAAVAAGCTFTGAKNEEAEVTPLTAEELTQFNKAFEPLLYDGQGSPISVNPLSQFFTSYYDRPEDINLAELLRYFPSDADVTDITEFEALKAEKNWTFGAGVTLDGMPVPIHKFSADTVNKALREYAGITLDDLSGVGFNELIYLEAYDAFYNFTSDAGAGVFVCISGEKQGDIVRLYGESATLTLKVQDEDFLIVSHQRAAAAVPAPSGTAVTNGETAFSDALLTITSGGETAAPYENILWAHTYDGNGWMYGDGRSVAYSLEEISESLPTVTLREDISISYADGVERRGGLDVYDENFERIYEKADMLLLTGLPEGTYTIAIRVEKRGEYSEAGGDYESFGYECVFRYVVDEHAYDGFLMSRPAADKVCVMLRLTDGRGQAGYLAPDEQEKWLSALERAAQSAVEGKSWLDSELSLGVYIVRQDEYWQFTESGALLHHSRGRVEPEDAAALYSLLQPITEKYGIGAFRPEMVRNLVSATLEFGENHTVTDADTLSRLQGMLSGAAEIRGGAGCPFDAIVSLELEDGKTLRLAMATDSCAAYMVNGVYFDYGSGDNTAFFSLFGLSA